MKAIYQKLMDIQQKLKAPKNQYNNFGKYKYRSCEDVLEAVKPLLGARRLVLRISDDVSNVGDRFYIKALCELVDIDSGEGISAVAYARESEDRKGQDESQITGTASSYARKYALSGLFMIDDTKDAEATNQHVVLPQQKPLLTSKDAGLWKRAVASYRQYGDLKKVEAHRTISDENKKKIIEEAKQAEAAANENEMD